MKQAPDSIVRITRRRMMLGAAALSALPGKLFAEDSPQMKQLPATEANRTRTSLSQQIEIKADPHRIYSALLDAGQFASFSGAPAQIDARPGGRFTLFGGQIEGCTLELTPDERIVQAWRPADWEPGLYSNVRFTLKPAGGSTMLTLNHSGFPEGGYDHLGSGWHEHYWEPLKKFLA
jgi:activator of HSP90 ATPase